MNVYVSRPPDLLSAEKKNLFLLLLFLPIIVHMIYTVPIYVCIVVVKLCNRLMSMLSRQRRINQR